jgi:hypothetical protein
MSVSPRAALPRGINLFYKKHKNYEQKNLQDKLAGFVFYYVITLF